MAYDLINPNPLVHEKKERREKTPPGEIDEYAVEPIDQQEIYEDIKDPEHPYSLEELRVITEDSIEVDDKRSYVRVTFTPTVKECGLARMIGLCLRVKHMRCLPSRFKVDIRVAPGTHKNAAAETKQLNDKERVAAAMENPDIMDKIEECLAPTYVSPLH